MKKYNLKRSLAALGLAVSITLTGCQGKTSSKSNESTSNSNINITDLETKDQEVKEEYQAKDILVFDNDYLEAQELTENTNTPVSQYHLVVFEKSSDDYYDYIDPFNKNLTCTVHLNTFAEKYEGEPAFIINAFGAVHIHDDENNKIFSGLYRANNIFTLNSFLHQNNLTNLIKESYTKEDLQTISSYLNSSEFTKSSNDTYNLEDILVVDMSAAFTWKTTRGTRNYYLLAPKSETPIDKSYDIIIKHGLKDKSELSKTYQDLKYPGSVEAIMTDSKIYFINTAYLKDALGMVTCLEATKEEGMKITPLKEFLTTHELTDLISSTYEEASLLDLYDYLNNDLDYTRN